MTDKKKVKTTYTTAGVDARTYDMFKEYCERRGFKLSRALSLAMESWMNGGCDQNMEEFKESN